MRRRKDSEREGKEIRRIVKEIWSEFTFFDGSFSGGRKRREKERKVREKIQMEDLSFKI